MQLVNDLMRGIVIETRTWSCTGHALYSDQFHQEFDKSHELPTWAGRQPFLNKLSTYDVIGILAGLSRMALAIIHSIGHLFAALFTWNKGHCMHAAKGACEFLRGSIEAIPFLGRSFAKRYYYEGEWWMIKIYNPNCPDTLDQYTNKWASLKQNRPSAYFVY